MRNRNWLWVSLGFLAIGLFCMAVTAKAQDVRRGPLGLADWRGQLTVPCPVWPSEPWSAPQQAVNRLSGQQQVANYPQPVAAEPEVPQMVYVNCTIGVVCLSLLALSAGAFVQARNAVHSSTPRT